MCDFNEQNNREQEQLQERETEQVKLETRKGPGRLSGILLGSDFAHLRLIGEKVKGTQGHIRDDFQSEILILHSVWGTAELKQFSVTGQPGRV